MPLGYERINEKRSTPNKNIVFIKPRPGSDEANSRDFLERIAAQCVPIMNKHHLSVVSVEEYEPNLEFWGRNFNNGEVIQLVLKSPSTGRWLPFKFVQMVMMHELAHCKQMNHSKAFWKVRNDYSTEMKALWAREYTGDGLWGRGLLLENGAFSQEDLGNDEVLPENLCGGTFKSRRGKKRKLRPKITYKERQETRIKKKFGINGMVLGADEEVKANLEKGKRGSGKPRVAGSTRGRELRAAAAMARFDCKKEKELVTDSETESEDEKEISVKTESDDALDIDGKILLDSDGHGMVKVCEEDEPLTLDAQTELSELQSLHTPAGGKTRQDEQFGVLLKAANPCWSFRTLKKEKIANPISSASQSSDIEHVLASEQLSSIEGSSKNLISACTVKTSNSFEVIERQEDDVTTTKTTAVLFSCPVCSTGNVKSALTCTICSHVLKADLVVGAWNCTSISCEGSTFINAGDYGVCQVCGARKKI